MSAMLRAHKAGKNRRTRSFSLSDESSIASFDSDDVSGATAFTMNDSHPRVRFSSSITRDFGRMSFVSSAASGGSDRDDTSSVFQLGKKPSGDVFTDSPVKSALKIDEDKFKTPVRIPTAENKANGSPIKDTEGRRHQRSVTTGGAMVLSGSGNRTLRSSSSRHKIGGIDAQGIYPPSACVFIANLPESKDDRALEAAVTREFSRYGTVFVKIRREMRGANCGMPYAFAQFTNDDDAKAAVEMGRGTLIFGRPCRTEMVKANRVFVVYSRDGLEITTDTVMKMLEPYGELSKCEYLSDEMQATLNLPSAVLVEFAKFDPKRDLNSAVRQYDRFCIDAFDLKKNAFVSRANPDEEFLRKYDVDRRSVFVGNVSVDSEKEEIADFFSAVGKVLEVTLIKRANHHGVLIRAFAFVEFARADTPDHAIKHLNGSVLRGSVLKVERKAFKHVGTPRRVKSQAFSIKTTTTPKTPRTDAPTASGSVRYSAKKETPVRASEQEFNLPDSGQAFVPFPFPPLASPVPPADGKPLLGASGLPVTPLNTTPFAPNPFTYAGGYWPGMSIAQDPITGHTFWAYTPPVGANTTDEQDAEPPSPTRSSARKHYRGGH
ncbi:ade77c36-9680-474a-84be-1a322862978e [Thermothielavioides terrestris]|uniref:Ade77c36-9680-474a-84be-1a322862978e n=1 Tax=Thermothielavioides terrestris TaxID=2587410 RepID=A0A3S4AKH7_9PEZI|nr:ade77c36-9680-474a-84be-1a322862978e [Thermothielavioides terrestris]